ncbi:unnamed protein product [Ophioblennius macclurei]
MSGIMKVFLLLAVLVCISKAQMDRTGNLCKCSRTLDAIPKGPKIRGIQIHPETTFCDKIEIVVTRVNGTRFCLAPSFLPRLHNMLAKKPKAPAAK